MTFATFNPADTTDTIILSGGNLVATATTSTVNEAARGSQFKSAGQWYCEITLTLNGGISGTIPRIGLSTSAYVVDPTAGGALGVGATEYCYRADGNKQNNNVAAGYGSSYTTGDVISVVYDADADTLIFWKNGVSQGTAYTGVTALLAITCHDVGVSVFTANFGASAFIYTPPSGHIGWDDGVTDVTEPSDLNIEVRASSPATFQSSVQPSDLNIEVRAASPATFQSSVQPSDLNIEVSVASPSQFISILQDVTEPSDLNIEVRASSPATFQSSVQPSDLNIEVRVASPVSQEQARISDQNIELGISSPAVFTASPFLLGTAMQYVFSMAGTTENLGIAGDLTYRYAVAGQINAGNVYSADLTYRYALAAATLPAAELVYRYSMDATLLPGNVLNGDLYRHSYSLTGTLLQDGVYTGAMSYRWERIVGAVSVEGLLSAALTWPRLRVQSTLLAGADWVGDITYRYEVNGVHYGSYELSGALTYRWASLSASMLADAANLFTTWVMNTRDKGLTEYSNFDFNSYANFRGVVLSAGATGIVPHTASNDDGGAPIVALVRTGKESFGSSYNKRLPRLYVVYSTVGDMQFSTYTSQDGKRTYLLPNNRIAGVQTRRVPIGRGPKSPHWQLELTNPNGEDFSLTSLQAYPEKSSRRVV